MSSWDSMLLSMPAVYSNPSAPGIIMASGNVGVPGVGLDDNDGCARPRLARLPLLGSPLSPSHHLSSPRREAPKGRQAEWAAARAQWVLNGLRVPDGPSPAPLHAPVVTRSWRVRAHLPARTLLRRLCTWLSTDGGVTWRDVALGSYIYEYADWGGFIVMARHPGRSDKAAGATLFSVPTPTPLLLCPGRCVAAWARRRRPRDAESRGRCQSKGLPASPWRGSSGRKKRAVDGGVVVRGGLTRRPCLHAACADEVLFSYDGGNCWSRVPLSEALLLDNIRCAPALPPWARLGFGLGLALTSRGSTATARHDRRGEFAVIVWAWRLAPPLASLRCRIEPDGQRPRVILHGRRCRKSVSPMCAYDAEAPRQGVLEGVMYLVDLQVRCGAVGGWLGVGWCVGGGCSRASHPPLPVGPDGCLSSPAHAPESATNEL